MVRMTSGCWRACVVLSVMSMASPALAADWLPVDPAELALAKPRVDPNADSEALLWDVKVTDQRDGDSYATVYQHYLRIKIFTERGREAHSKVDLPYTPFARVRDVEGRTIAPNGTITELAGRDVFDRTIVETSGLKLKARSFALPSVVPGSVIEYQWREIHDESLAQNVELAFQRDIPAHVVRYHIKPLPLRDVGYGMASQAFNISGVAVVQEKDGYTMLQASNMPALKREPYMPAELSLKSWVLIYYRSIDKGDPPAEKFWSDFAREESEALKPAWKVTGDIQKAATQAVAGATTVADKVAAVLRFARERVKRTDADTTPEALARERKANKDVTATLKRGAGTASDLTLLVGAMATAAGLDTRLALMPDRSHSDARPDLKQPYFYRHLGIAVRDGANWRFVDPANEHAPGGHTRWQQEGAQALLLDGKAPAFAAVPWSPAGFSTRRRNASLRLLENGTLEGTVTLEYTGHMAVQYRERDDDETEAERKRLFTEEFARRVPGIEIADFAVEHLTDPEQPYVVRFSLRAPGYAERAGSRMLLAPAAIQRGAESVFTAAERRHDLDFRFAWNEDDTVTIDLPAGFDVEAAAPPQAMLIDEGRSAKYQVELTSTGGRLSYKRSFFVGAGGPVVFSRQAYPVFKRLFDAVHAGDAHVVTLRRVAQ